MKIPQIVTSIGILFVATSAAFPAELSQGPAIDATDLAKLLNAFTVSLVYKRETPFSKLTVERVYRERNSDETYSDKKELFYTTYDLPKQVTEQTIKVLLSADASAIIVGGSSSRGKGMQLSSPNSSLNPPSKNEDGSFSMVTVYEESEKSKPKVKGVLTLIAISGN